MPSAEAAPSHLPDFAGATDLAATKRAVRAEARLRRLGATRPGAAEDLRDHALSALPITRASVVAGYWPLAGELDPRPLMLALHARGAALALPVSEARGRPLRFRRWEPGEPLAPGLFGVMEPGPEAPELVPDVLLIPLLAFDRRGGRLGYGAGFYDRTLAELRAGRGVLAVGLAYAAQEMPAVPCEAHDEPLDWILTEAGASSLAARSRAP